MPAWQPLTGAQSSNSLTSKAADKLPSGFSSMHCLCIARRWVPPFKGQVSQADLSLESDLRRWAGGLSGRHHLPVLRLLPLVRGVRGGHVRRQLLLPPVLLRLHDTSSDASAAVTSSFAVQLGCSVRTGSHATAPQPPRLTVSTGPQSGCCREGRRALLQQSGCSAQGAVPTAKAVSSPMGLWRLCIGVTVGAFSSVRCSSDRSSAVRRRSCGDPAAALSFIGDSQTARVRRQPNSSHAKRK